MHNPDFCYLHSQRAKSLTFQNGYLVDERRNGYNKANQKDFLLGSCRSKKIMIMPNQENIKVAQEIYDQLSGWKVADDVISGCFQKYKQNLDIDIVVVKVRLINALYNTNIFAPIKMAEHITSIQGLDSGLEDGDKKCVDLIADFKGRHFTVFASKYAHFNNKEAFPICDQYVCKALANITNRGFSWPTYKDFYEVIDSFRRLSGLKDVTWSGIDHYLWLYGLKLSLQEGNNDISYEIESYYRTLDGLHLFKKLIPMGLLPDN